jgi:hypothetical protein
MLVKVNLNHGKICCCGSKFPCRVLDKREKNNIVFKHQRLLYLMAIHLSAVFVQYSKRVFLSPHIREYQTVRKAFIEKLQNKEVCKGKNGAAESCSLMRYICKSVMCRDYPSLDNIQDAF